MPCGKYIWGSYKYYDFEKHLSTDYEKIVFWKKNLFAAAWESRKKIP